MLANRPETLVAAEFFRALGDETRLRLVALLSHGELCVCHLVSALDLPQSTVSRQLTVLRQAEVVTTRREGTWVHYSLAEPSDLLLRQHIDLLKAEFGANQVIKADVTRLIRSRGPGQCS